MADSRTIRADDERWATQSSTALNRSAPIGATASGFDQTTEPSEETGLAVEDPIVASLVAVDPDETETGSSTTPTAPERERVGIFRRLGGFIGWSIRGGFCIASLIVLLAVLTAIPVFQLIAFGYLLQVAGGLAGGEKLSRSLPHLRRAGQIGLAAVAVIIAALPTQLLAHWESVAYLIHPGSGQATMMRVLAITSAMLATGYLLWAWVRGGRLRHYLWPQPKRFLREGWRLGTWADAPDRLWDFTASLELPKYFWLGLRGAAGTLIWLLPAMIIIAAFRNGETGLAGLVGFISLVFLGIGMLYLPMLQANFAAENRISALFEVRKIRRDFGRAPWAWLLAMIISLVITPIPLYLLKIEATPREVMWLPCLVFVAFILPARIATGLAPSSSPQTPGTVGLLGDLLTLDRAAVDAGGGRDLPAVRLCLSIHQLGWAGHLGATARDLDPGAVSQWYLTFAVRPPARKSCSPGYNSGVPSFPSLAPAHHAASKFEHHRSHGLHQCVLLFRTRRAKTAMMVGDALQLIDTYYVDPVDEHQLLIAAMNGMTGMLDEHSQYIPREDYESFQDSINQEFAGIGIFVEQPELGKPVRVITPLVGSPALAAGMLPGDQIVRVDDEDVSAMALRNVSARLKGKVGTIVKLTVRRNEDQVTMTVRRGQIELESVIGDYRETDNRWVYRLLDDPSIAYVRLTSFGERTVDELQQVLIDLDNDFDALVLDLRGNGGGLLHAAVDVSNMFLDSGKIVSTRTRGGEIEDRFSAERGTLVVAGKPVAVLMDGNSASASEIVAACLQDNGRAIVVGTRSYGKGTVQNILPLQYGRSTLRLTVARYYRPNGLNIHRSNDATDEDQWGVRPDEGMEVELDEASLEKLANRWQEASYPSLAGIAQPSKSDSATTEQIDAEQTDAEQTDTAGTGDRADPDANSAEEAGQGEDIDPAQEAVKVESGLMIDPQLRRAVEALHEVIRRETGTTAAA